MRRIRLLIVLLLTLSLGVTGSGRAEGEASGTLKIKFFKSGKADAFLIRTEQYAVLIDSGEEDDAEDILDYLAEKEVARLDLMILTHYDGGHIGGAPQILDAVPVGRVMMPAYDKQSDARDALNAAIARSGAEPLLLEEDSEFTLDGVAFQIITAKAAAYPEDEDNDFCLVTRLRHGANSFLFGADILSQRMQELMDSGEALQASFLQVPDHGRSRDLTEAFIRAVHPRYAVITCSAKNPPAGAVLALLEALGTRYYLTMDGNIALTSDGLDLKIKQ
ncbi:MAG: ComEC/Rec2 family competence protein [Christensenellales bacterium]